MAADPFRDLLNPITGLAAHRRLDRLPSRLVTMPRDNDETPFKPRKPQPHRCERCGETRKNMFDGNRKRTCRACWNRKKKRKR